MPEGEYVEELKIGDINGFSRLKGFTKLVREGKIDLGKEEDKKKVSSKRLYKAVKGEKKKGEEISEEEGYLILGDDIRIIDNFKKDEIEERYKGVIRSEEYRGKNKRKEGEKDREYRKRLEKKAREEGEGSFKWDIARIGKVMEELGYENDEEKQEKMFVVLMGEGIKSEDMVRRYRNVSEMRGIVDGSVDLKVLGNDRMFREDNKVSEEFISEYVRAELILRGVNNKLKREGYEGTRGGEELVGKMGEGFTKGEEFSIAIAQALWY